MGSSITVDIHMPIHAGDAPLFESFSPVMEIIYQSRKNAMAMIIGMPIPPFLIIAPSGAPIRNNKMHANDRLNFLWNSTFTLSKFSFCNLRSLTLICTSSLMLR